VNGKKLKARKKSFRQIRYFFERYFLESVFCATQKIEYSADRSRSPSIPVGLPKTTPVALANHQRGTVPRCEFWHGRTHNRWLLAWQLCVHHQVLGKRICHMHIRPNYFYPHRVFSSSRSPFYPRPGTHIIGTVTNYMSTNSPQKTLTTKHDVPSSVYKGIDASNRWKRMLLKNYRSIVVCGPQSTSPGESFHFR
jgi:hypothetical protein